MKKLCLIAISIVLCLSLCIFAAACDEVVPTPGGDDTHTHAYTFKIDNEPTLTEQGKATGTCECGETLEVTLPVLTDAVWTKGAEVVADHTKDGSVTYTSEYGTVIVVLPKINHSYGSEYTILEEPGMDNNGLASHTCSCGEEEQVSIPALVERGVWTEVLVQAGTHDLENIVKYTSIYGEVTITTPAEGHEYGETYTIVDEPTLDAGGTATHACSCGDEEIIGIPELSNGTWWDAQLIQQGSHTLENIVKYVSIYGEVTVTTPAAGHEYGAYTLLVEPTLTSAGSASHTCSCGDSETVDVPVLTDTTVWTHVNTPATYNTDGSDSYVSDFAPNGIIFAIAKLRAPYDTLSYDRMAEIDDGVYIRTSAQLVMGEEAATKGGIIGTVGMGTGYPFQGETHIKMVDAATGAIEVVVYATASVETESGLQLNVNYEDIRSSFTGFVNSDGAMVLYKTSGLANDIIYLAPQFVELGNDDIDHILIDANNHFISYTKGNDSLNAFVTSNGVVFDVEVVGISGDPYSVGDPYIYFKKGDAVVAGFAIENDSYIALDGFEGVYNFEEENKQLLLNGFGGGGLTTEFASYGIRYQVAQDADYTLDLYVTLQGVDQAYLRVTLSDKVDFQGTFTYELPVVTATFDTITAPAYSEEYSAMVSIELPECIPADESQLFVGWNDGTTITKPGETYFFAEGQNVTFVAVYGTKCVVEVKDTLDGDITIFLATGENVYDAMPPYTVATTDEAGTKSFLFWFVDLNDNGTFEDGDIELGEDMTIEEGMTSVTIVACWKLIPAYVGTYYGGNNLYGIGATSATSSYTNLNSSTITIDEAGVVTYGTKTVTLGSEPTFVLDGKNCYLNQEAGVLVRVYNNTDGFGKDAYWYFKDAAGDKVAHYGIKVGTQVSYRALQFSKDGIISYIFATPDAVYANVTFTLVDGTPLSVFDLYDQSNVVIKQGENTIAAFGLASGSTKLHEGAVLLDGFQGTYLAGEATLTLDGAGNATYNGKTGTYSSSQAEAGFSMLLADGTEYYEFTLDGDNATVVMPMATIVFHTNGGVALESISVNINVPTTLPTTTRDGHVFRGWYLDDTLSTSAEGWNATYADTVDLYAKWLPVATFTANYVTDGVDSLVVAYGVGEVVEIDNPTREGKAFVGWFTTEDYAAGSEWTSGTVINADTTVFAKWADPHAMAGSYAVFQVAYSDGVTTQSSYNFTISNEGILSGTKYAGNLNNVDANGNFDVKEGNTTYNNAYYYADGEIIVIPYTSSTSPIHRGMFAIKGVTAASQIKTYGFGSSSKKEARLVSITIGEETYVYFYGPVGTSICIVPVTSITDGCGNELALANIKNSKTVIIKNGTDVLFAKASNSAKFDSASSLIELDGNQGIYQAADEKSVAFDGAGNAQFDGKTGTYAATETGNVFAMYLANNSEYYLVTIDGENATVVKPMATITFNADGGSEVSSVEVNLNVPYAIEQVSTKDGFVFRGWYLVTPDAQPVQYTTYTATSTEGITLTAKWLAKVTFTANFDKEGMDPLVEDYGAGESVTIKNPECEGFIFLGWFTTPTCSEGSEWTSGASIEADTTVYAKWDVAHPMTGSYNPVELESTLTKNLRTSTTISIDGYGAISGKFSGNLNSFVDGALVISGKPCFYIESEKVFIGAYGTSMASDAYYVVKGVDSVSAYTAVGLKGTGSNVEYRVINVTRADDNLQLFVTTDKAYVITSLTDLNGNPISNVDDVRSVKGICVICEGGATFSLVSTADTLYVGSSAQSTMSLDGTEGVVYQGDLGDIESNGAGTLTKGTDQYAYTAMDSAFTISVVMDGRMVIINLDKASGSYALANDGFQGTYTLPDSATTIELDGYGNVTEGGVYAIVGGTITITNGGDVVSYGIIFGNSQLLGKSIYAGLTFSGKFYDNWDESNKNLYVVFADSSALEGTMYVSSVGSSYYFNFTAAFDAVDSSKLVFTITKAYQSKPNSVINATVVDNKITFTSDFGSNTDTIKNSSVTCPDLA